jgi:UDPglucose 6-dehydrogenase
MKITIAGYGTLGHYVESVFGRRHEIALYDPPQGLRDESTLVDADFVFVCVPTPEAADGSCDTSIVEDIVSLARPRVAIVCQSTVAIGTTQALIDASGKPIVFVPEYAGEAVDHPYRELARREFFIYGGQEPAVSRVRDLFLEVAPGASHSIVDPTTAETIKYMENSFLALKVAFCNEFYDFCRALDLDYEPVRRLWSQDWRIGPSHTYVTEERGYAGKCLPKDVAAVCKTARSLGTPLGLMESALRSNARVRARGATAL